MDIFICLEMFTFILKTQGKLNNKISCMTYFINFVLLFEWVYCWKNQCLNHSQKTVLLCKVKTDKKCFINSTDSFIILRNKWKDSKVMAMCDKIWPYNIWQKNIILTPFMNRYSFWSYKINNRYSSLTACQYSFNLFQIDFII